MSHSSQELRNSHFYCPIREEVMRDPVIDPEGNSYEREAIMEWLSSHNTSPITRTPLTADQLIPNRSLRKAIEDEQEEQSREMSIKTASISRPSTASSDSVQVNPDVKMTLAESEDPAFLDLLVTITPPVQPPSKRGGCDICCVVDVSGSMGGDASIPGVENSGLCLLDVVQHALRTIISILQENDRLSLVSYSNSANVLCGLTPMNDAGKSRVLSLVSTLQPDGMTNLWDGLKKGLDTLTESSTQTNSHNGVRNSAVFLLTDGEPNVTPPRGHIPMLKRYREQHEGKFPGTISTFGFGYGVQSALLRDMAVEAGGMYAFIPDSGFVGTAFINALSNQLVTMGTQASLSLEIPSDITIPDESHIVGQSSCVITSWGAIVYLGSIKYGQSKEVLFRLKAEGVSRGSLISSGGLVSTLSYAPIMSSRPNSATPMESTQVVSKIMPTTAELTACLDAHRFRCEAISIVLNILTEKLAFMTPNTCFLESLMSRMREWLAEHRSSANALYYTAVEGLLKDLSGQVQEAMEDQYFKKWGRHYLPSLVRAHQLQECLNFKDPGVQCYGGKMFQDIRDLADDAFNSLPPPTPSNHRPMRLRSNLPNRKASSVPVVVNMSNFNCASAPCFHGDCLVHLEDGSLKRCSEINKGDKVLCNMHHSGNKVTSYAVVECVVETKTSSGMLDLVHFSSGLQATPYHPVFTSGDSSSDDGWQFPIDHKACKCIATKCSSIFSFVLGPAISRANGEVLSSGRAESMLINGVICISLAHGISNSPVASHPFYGTEMVVKSLMEVNPERYTEEGRVILKEGCVMKDMKTGLAIGFDNNALAAVGNFNECVQ